MSPKDKLGSSALTFGLSSAVKIKYEVRGALGAFGSFLFLLAGDATDFGTFFLAVVFSAIELSFVLASLTGDFLGDFFGLGFSVIGVTKSVEGDLERFLSFLFFFFFSGPFMEEFMESIRLLTSSNSFSLSLSFFFFLLFFGEVVNVDSLSIMEESTVSLASTASSTLSFSASLRFFFLFFFPEEDEAVLSLRIEESSTEVINFFLCSSMSSELESVSILSVFSALLFFFLLLWLVSSLETTDLFVSG